MPRMLLETHMLLSIWRNLFGKKDDHPEHCSHYHGVRPSVFPMVRLGYCCICGGRNPNLKEKQ